MNSRTLLRAVKIWLNIRVRIICAADAEAEISLVFVWFQLSFGALHNNTITKHLRQLLCRMDEPVFLHRICILA